MPSPHTEAFRPSPPLSPVSPQLYLPTENMYTIFFTHVRLLWQKRWQQHIWPSSLVYLLRKMMTMNIALDQKLKTRLMRTQMVCLSLLTLCIPFITCWRWHAPSLFISFVAEDYYRNDYPEGESDEDSDVDSGMSRVLFSKKIIYLN